VIASRDRVRATLVGAFHVFIDRRSLRCRRVGSIPLPLQAKRFRQTSVLNLGLDGRSWRHGRDGCPRLLHPGTPAAVAAASPPPAAPEEGLEGLQPRAAHRRRRRKPCPADLRRRQGFAAAIAAAAAADATGVHPVSGARLAPGRRPPLRVRQVPERHLRRRTASRRLATNTSIRCIHMSHISTFRRDTCGGERPHGG
jgi:hypothetical protein